MRGPSLPLLDVKVVVQRSSTFILPSCRRSRHFLYTLTTAFSIRLIGHQERGSHVSHRLHTYPLAHPGLAPVGNTS